MLLRSIERTSTPALGSGIKSGSFSSSESCSKTALAMVDMVVVRVKDEISRVASCAFVEALVLLPFPCSVIGRSLLFHDHHDHDADVIKPTSIGQ